MSGTFIDCGGDINNVRAGEVAGDRRGAALVNIDGAGDALHRDAGADLTEGDLNTAPGEITGFEGTSGGKLVEPVPAMATSRRLFSSFVAIVCAAAWLILKIQHRSQQHCHPALQREYLSCTVPFGYPLPRSLRFRQDLSQQGKIDDILRLDIFPGSLLDDRELSLDRTVFS